MTAGASQDRRRLPRPTFSSQPTVWLSHWERRAGQHGPGRTWSIHSPPAVGEGSADGWVPALTPLGLVAGLMAIARERRDEASLEAFRRKYLEQVMQARAMLGPDLLLGYLRSETRPSLVGWDTLCCSCSIADAAAGRCHRAWAAHLLAASGWRVFLDGHLVEVA